MSDNKTIVWIIALFMASGCIYSICEAYKESRQCSKCAALKLEAIRMGHAEYSSTNGGWQWRTNK